jgi:molecular chaperone GrpE (heat shock protein)
MSSHLSKRTNELLQLRDKRSQQPPSPQRQNSPLKIAPLMNPIPSSVSRDEIETIKASVSSSHQKYDQIYSEVGRYTNEMNERYLKLRKAVAENALQPEILKRLDELQSTVQVFQKGLDDLHSSVKTLQNRFSEMTDTVQKLDEINETMQPIFVPLYEKYSDRKDFVLGFFKHRMVKDQNAREGSDNLHHIMISHARSKGIKLTARNIIKILRDELNLKKEHTGDFYYYDGYKLKE